MPKHESPAGLRSAEVARVVKAAQKAKEKIARTGADLHAQAAGPSVS